MDATLLGLLGYIIFNFLIISFIFIENKCLSEAICDLKRDKKVRQKVSLNSGRSHQKALALPCIPLKLM